MIILRKHKDDPEMVEILSNRPTSKMYPKGGLIVWGMVHTDMIGDLLSCRYADIDRFNEEGEIEIYGVTADE